MAQPALAGAIPSAAAGDGSGQIAQLISDIAVAVVRLMVASGAALFVLGVARGAFDGVLASALGVAGTARDGLVRVVGVVGAFLFLMVSFGLSRGFVDLIIAQFVDRGALSPPVPGPVDVYVPNNANGLQPLAGVIGEGLQVVLFLIGAWFVVSMLVAVINGEIGVATGSPGAMARLVERIVTSLVVLLIGVLAPSLARDLGACRERRGRGKQRRASCPVVCCSVHGDCGHLVVSVGSTAGDWRCRLGILSSDWFAPGHA